MGLKELRQGAGLTLKGLAALSGVNYMKIHQIESGIIKTENITLRNAQKLADALGCEPKDLIPLPEEKSDGTPVDPAPMLEEEPSC